MGNLSSHLDIKTAFKDIDSYKAIIIDVRHGIDTDPSFEIPLLFCRDRGAYLRTKYPVCIYPSTFKYYNEMNSFLFKKKIYKGAVILLVDENVQSISEGFCLRMQQNKSVKIIGSQTSGAYSEVVYIPMPFSTETPYTAIGEYYLNGTMAMLNKLKL